MITSPGTMKQMPPMSAPRRPRSRQAQKMASWVEAGSGKQVGRGNAVFELVGGHPAPFFDAELPKQGDMGGRAAEADDPDAAPLAHDGGERHTDFGGVRHDRCGGGRAGRTSLEANVAWGPQSALLLVRHVRVAESSPVLPRRPWA